MLMEKTKISGEPNYICIRIVDARTPEQAVANEMFHPGIHM